jgi:AAA+ ATPase superfamily predicted ATPase
MNNINSPFKLLDPYTLEDREIFFGRDREIEELYQMCFHTSLLLVYGQSGTGKTSLIRCGLANRFKKTDWFDLFVRRQNNINDSMREAIRKSAKTEIEATATLSEMISSIFLDYYKPIFLIFDQFEELFISGTKPEQEQFINDIAFLLRQTDLPCKIIFAMREEYIAQLYDFEKIIPELFNKRLRVEPMSLANTRAVIVNTCSKFNIALDEGVADQIVSIITEDRGRVQLPYLQVFLDLLYKKAYAIHPYNINFTKTLLQATGRIDDVLVNFMEQQLTAFAQEHDKTTALRFLKAFVTIKGTKIPVQQHRLIGMLPGFTQKEIQTCLEFFVNRRILRPLENEQFELTHDSLAARIAAVEVKLYHLPDIADSEYPEAAYSRVGYYAYTKEMCHLFFGRDQEIKTLFDKVANEPQSRTTIVYGAVGVGKTSLILAGLLPRLEKHFSCTYVKIEPTLIKRIRENLIYANNENTKGLLYGLLAPEATKEEASRVLILDQFEEFFIWLANDTEKDFLYKQLAQLLNEQPNIRIVFVVREDFFSQLSDFETTMPDLLDSRLRVDPINPKQAQLIVKGIAKHNDVNFENQAVIDNIIANLSEADGKINPTFLQLYMERLCTEAG